jgi:transposase
MSSLKKLRKSLKKDEEIFSLTRKEYSKPLSNKKFSDLIQVTHDFVKAQNYFLKHFAGIKGLAYLSYPHGLRDEYVKNGLPKDLARLGIQDRQWKMALDVAFDTIKSSHAKTQDHVRSSLNRSSVLNESEKHLIRYLLKHPSLLYFICHNRVEEAKKLILIESHSSKFNKALKANLLGTQEEPALDPIKVFTWLRRRYRELHAKHQLPVVQKLRTYHVDSNMFKFFKEKETCYLSVASKTPRKRIVLPLTNKHLKADDFSGNVKVVLRKDGKAEIHRTLHTVIKKTKLTQTEVIQSPKGHKIVSIDKGLSCLIHTDGEKKYGDGFSKKACVWSDTLTAINSGRARFHSLVRELEKNAVATKNLKTKKELTAKIKRIQENNLGDLKVTRQRERVQNELKTEIGTAVNSLYASEKPDVLVTENLKFLSFKNLGKRTNRLLNTWSKGSLRDVLEKGAKKNGVLLAEVNAAFSSQQCRACSYVHRNNRRGELFACVFCQHKENANFAAAKTVKDRFFDSEIQVYTPVTEVKNILLKRHRMSLSIQGLNGSVNRPSSANYQEIT